MNRKIETLTAILWGRLLLSPILWAQTEEMVFLTGVEQMESLDHEVIERFESLLASPLKINLASRSRLLASGLFSTYQLEVLETYRKEYGAVLSWMELAYLDGFGEAYARALRPFVSFVVPGLDTDGSSRYNDGIFRISTGWSRKGWSEGLKFQYNHHERWELALAFSNTSGHPFYPIERHGFHFTYYGKYRLRQLIVGDFNVRFGQGLGLWTGFSMKGMGGFQTFFRRPAGLTPTCSWSDTNFRGIAANFNRGRWHLSTAVAFPGMRPWMEGDRNAEIQILPFTNLCYQSDQGQMSMTIFSLRRIAFDFQYSFRSISFWGETATSFAPFKWASVAGIRWNKGYQQYLSLAVKWFPVAFDKEYTAPVSMKGKAEDERGIALGLDMKGYVFTLDGAWHREEGLALKGFFYKEWPLDKSFTLTTRCTDKFQFQCRSNKLEFRMDGKWRCQALESVLRIATSHAESWGLLSYWEAGYRKSRWSVFVRGSLFKVDHWADRIYVYERDAPGNFNVPAYYGRGYSVSLYTSLKIPIGWKNLKFYLRTGMVRYPWEEEKPGKAELKFQMVYDF